jgi:arylsulfatase A-like enzyme
MANEMNKGLIAGIVGVVALVGVGAYVMSQSGPKVVVPPPRPAQTANVAAPRPVNTDGPPNVIIILWDTVRADRMSLYGYGLDTTPRIKSWAEANGMVYDNAISPAMWTVPSHASMFSGVPPSTHGACFDHRWLDDANVTLAEHFQNNGYDTYAFSANPNLSPNRVNLLQGFDKFDLSWGRKWKQKVVAHTRKKLMKTDRSTEISPANEGKHKGVGFYNAGPITHEAMTTWLDVRPDSTKPFFVYLSYMEAHKPRVPKLESRKVVADDETIKLGLATDLTFNAQLLYSYDKMQYSEAELAAVNRVYDATLRDLDSATADLLDDLEARGVLDNTIVVLTADHGEQLGDHQQFGHRNGVYQDLVHVPLVIAYPKKLKPQRVEEPVSNLELYSTLVTLTGIDPLVGAQTITPGNLTDLTDRAMTIFSESISIDRLGFGKVKKQFPDLTRDVWANKYRQVTFEGYKLIENIDFDSEAVVSHELYHLETDPHEYNDLSASDPEKVASFVEKLHALYDAIPKWDPTAADETRNAEDEKGGNSAALREQLEMLGYTADEIDAEMEDGTAEEAAQGPAKAKSKGKSKGKGKGKGQKAKRPQ